MDMEREFMELCRAEYRLLDEQDDTKRKKLLKQISALVIALEPAEARRTVKVANSLGIMAKPLQNPEWELVG